MNIMIDCRYVFADHGGIRRLTLELLASLLKLDGKNSYFLLAYEDSERSPLNIFKKTYPNVRVVTVSYGPYSPKSLFLLPGVIKRNGIEIFHSMDFMIPLFSGTCRKISSIHDLIPYLHAEFSRKSLKSRFFFVYKILLRAIIGSADRIITISENSRRDIIRSLNVDGNKVNLIYCGLTAFRPYDAAAAWRSLSVRFALNGEFIFYAGRHDPYKNLSRLIEAFAAVGGQARLVIAGDISGRYREQYALPAKLGIADRVVFTGRVTDDELRALYEHARVFVFATLYEGFGLPPLEAMSCRCPVITSNVASLPEVVGDAALTVNPYSVPEITAAISKLLSDEGLRNELITRGVARASRFSWDEAAAKTLAVYESVAAG